MDRMRIVNWAEKKERRGKLKTGLAKTTLVKELSCRGWKKGRERG